MSKKPLKQAVSIWLVAISSLMCVMAGQADAVAERSVRLAAASRAGVHGFDLALGNRGYAVMVWTVRARTATDRQYWANVFVRTRAPKASNFGRRHFLGKSSSESAEVEIGATGATVVTWSGKDGRLRYVKRSPRSTWERPRTIYGARVSSAHVSIGRDGTIALASLRNGNLESGPSRVWGVSWAPGYRGIKKWRVVSRSAERVGFHADVVASTRGRGTVVWSGPCRAGKSKVATSWVDLASHPSGPPRRVSNSGCVPWDIDLQADRFDNQYLRLGLLGGVQLAVRKHGHGFSAATRVSPKGGNGGRGFLSVGANGLATIIWGTSASASGYHYVTSRRASAPGQSRKLIGARTGLSGTRDALMDVAPLPNGKLAMLWSEIGTKKQGGSWDKLGVKVWRPRTGFQQPHYSVGLPKNHIPYPTGIATADGGSWIAWWQLLYEHDSIGTKVLWIGK